MKKKLKEKIPVMLDDEDREAEVTLDPDEGYVILVLNDSYGTEIKFDWHTIVQLNREMGSEIEGKIGRIYVRWCKKEITGDDAMHQIYGLFREACDRVWRQDQNIGKGKPGRKPRS